MGGGYFDKHTMMVVVVKLVLGSIFYLYNVVVYNTYFTYTKMGATLPVLKNEIEDFFFARLGTGRTSQNRRATMRLRMYVIGKRLGVGILSGVIF